MDLKNFSNLSKMELEAYLIVLDRTSIISLSDSNGKIISVNQQFVELMGFQLSEIKNKSFKIFNSEIHNKEYFDDMKKIIKANQIWEGELCNKTKSGKNIWLHTTIFPITDSSNNILQFFSIYKNISDQRLIEENLIIVNKEIENNLILKNQFLARLSHEIKTPLNGILGMIDMLNHTEMNSEQKDYIDIIHHSSNRLLSLINNTIEYNLVEYGKFDVKVKKFAIIDDIEKIVETYKPICELKKINFKLINRLDNPFYIGDPKRIFQIVKYYIDNAVNFTQNGQVSLTLSQTDEGISFEVRDTGVGIAPDRIDNIFKPFVFECETGHEDITGMGLSLAIAAKIAKGLNAKIGFKSSIGHGSLFWLKVPIAHINKFEEIKIKPFFENTNISTVKVLVVEDDQINQRLLKKMLNKLNIYPDVVSNGLEALEIQASQKFNLIFMDINMPIMDGLEATKKMRERPEKYGNPYIVAVTANSVSIDQENSINAGMNDYIAKPIIRDDLSKLLNKILGISELPVNINKNKVIMKYYLEKTLDEFKGDEEILNSFIYNFVTKVPARLDKLEKAIKEHNFQSIQIEAHNLKDLVSNIYQEEMRSTLELFENYGADKKIKNIYPLFHDLKNDFKILIDELNVQFLKKAA